MNPSVLTVYKSPFPKQRLGKDNDGGYVICDIPDIQYNILIACGIAGDISFEEDFCNKYSTTKCLAFDGTINNMTATNPNITFIKKNIGTHNDNNVTNLHEFINDSENTSIFIKMDIEGGEIPWVKTLDNSQLQKIDQIVMEFHNPFTDSEIEVFDKLNVNHLLVHFHANNCDRWRHHKGVDIPNFFECTYINKKYIIGEPEFNTDRIPGNLDMPNLTDRSDIYINYRPFVHI